MITKLIYMGREQAKQHVNALVPTAVDNNFYASILCYDHGQTPIHLPGFIKPILRLQYNPCNLSRHYTFNSFLAERAVTFLDFVASSDSRFILFCISNRGLHRSAAFAKFVKIFQPQIPIESYGSDRLQFADKQTSLELEKVWAKKFNELHKGINQANFGNIKNDQRRSNESVKPIVRGEESNSRVSE